MSKLVTELKKMVKDARTEMAALAKNPPRYRSPEYLAAERTYYQAADLLVSAVCTTIEAAPTPTPRGAMRHATRKAKAAVVRQLLKDLGIEDVSVTAPSYSMAQAIHISVPDSSHLVHGDREFRECPRCRRRHAARERIERLILAAFPDLGDRSDAMTDHFDYCLSIG